MALAEFLMIYIFPMQLSIGLLGNVLNLIVLLSKGMRSKTNTVLAIMALADMLFLLFMLPHSLIINERLLKIPDLKRFIVYMHHHFTGIVNMCSFASAWLIVMVSVERMTAVIWPLRARTFWTSRVLISLVLGIWVSALALSMHWHVTHKVVQAVHRSTIKNATTGEIHVVERPMLKVELREEMATYFRFGVMSEMVTLVFVPVLLVLTSNVLMILALRQQDRQHDVRIKRQRRATLIVFIIASTFTICQIPSAIVHIVNFVWPEMRNQVEFRTAATLTNSLVVTSKTANFFLFCTWSSYFRRNLRQVIANKMPCFYKTLERSLARLQSNSALRESRNRLLGKPQVQRQQSHPIRFDHHSCEAPARVQHHHSLPLPNHRSASVGGLLDAHPQETVTLLLSKGEPIPSTGL